MQLQDALAGVGDLGLDTTPLIYLVERNPKYVALVREIFQHIANGRLEAWSSVITLVEVLTLPKRLGNRIIEREYNHILLSSAHLTLLPVDSVIADTAADLRARYNLRTPDAIQIATALQAGCEAFLTNDRRVSRVAELRVLVLDELTL